MRRIHISVLLPLSLCALAALSLPLAAAGDERPVPRVVEVDTPAVPRGTPLPYSGGVTDTTPPTWTYRVEGDAPPAYTPNVETEGGRWVWTWAPVYALT